MTMMGMAAAAAPLQSAVRLVGLVAFDFNLHRRVADAEVTAQFVDDRLENLLPLANCLLRHEDVTICKQSHPGPTVHTCRSCTPREQQCHGVAQ